MPSNAIHGKAAILYMAATAAGAAVPLGDQVDWSLDFDMATVDITPLNSTWKEFVKGLMGYSLSANGNFDPTSDTLFSASTDTGATRWYLYPLGAGDMTKYYYGTSWVQLGKVAAGSTTAAAKNGFKGTGQGALSKK